MAENTNAPVPGSGNFDVLKYLSDYTDAGYAHCMKKYPEREWMFLIQKAAWNNPYLAAKEGKRLLFLGAAVPPEIAFAFGATPWLTDAVATRLASDPDVINKYIDLGSEVVPSYVCAVDRSILGLFFSGDVKAKPDAYIYGSIPCDSARAAYPVVADKLRSQGVPTMVLDTPFRTDEFGLKYIADQIRDMVAFLEDIYGEKLDRNKLASVIYRSNEATRSLMAIAELRKLKPSYAMSRLLVLNELYMNMLGSQALVDFLHAEYNYIINNIEHKRTVVPEEKYRYTWVQDMLWSSVGTMDWMEQKYGAVCAMDVLGFNSNVIIEDPWDDEQVFMGLAARQLNIPMMHASSGPARPYVDMAEKIIKDYDIDVSMFVGHVGCKHTWACKKMVEDAIETRLGIPTFTLDIDAFDGRYKSTEEIQMQLAEYMDSLQR